MLANDPAKPKPTRTAKPAAKTQEVTHPVGPAQLEVANRVYTGSADCEFNQKVHVKAVDGKPGHFHVMHNQKTWTMVPQETTSGAVRLEDPRAGMVWIQIPAKSMLMNAKMGQRMVDSCLHGEQRSAAAADPSAPPR